MSEFLGRTLSLGLDETASCNGTQMAVSQWWKSNFAC